MPSISVISAYDKCVENMSFHAPKHEFRNISCFGTRPGVTSKTPGLYLLESAGEMLSSKWALFYMGEVPETQNDFLPWLHCL
jgi:hypothetical protein